MIRHDGGGGGAAVEATIFAPCGAVSGDVCSLQRRPSRLLRCGWLALARSAVGSSVCPSVLPLVAYDFLIPPTRRPSGFRPGAHALRRASGVGGQGMLTQNECSLGWRGANAYAPNRSSAAEGDDARFLPTSAVAFFNIHLSISDSASLFIFRQDSESLWNMKIDYRGALYGVLRVP